MEARAAGIRDVSLLALAAAIGVLLSSAIPLVGLPLAAAGLASLAYRGHTLAAAVSAAAGVAAVAVVSPTDVAYATPAVIAVLLAIVLLPRWNAQAVGALMIAILTAAGIGAAAVLAWSQHTTLSASINATSKQVADTLNQSLGSSASSAATAWVHQAAALLLVAWPWTYFESALFVGVIVIAVVTWSARRAGRQLAVPAIGELDLTPHVLWAFVVGLLLWAASTGSFAGSKTMWAVGVNLVLCSRTIFSLQGFCVSAGMLDRAGVSRGRRVLLLVLLLVLDTIVFVLSFVGLLDFWLNFRRLPRDGVTPAEASGSKPERRY